MTIKRFLTLGLTLLLTMGAWADISFGSEKTVSKTTTWTFEDFSDDITAHTLVKGTGYLRAYPRPNNNNDRQFSFESALGLVTFDTEVAYTQVAKASAKMVGINTNGFTTAATAGMTSASVAIPSFAFNASVAGTVYVAMKSASTSADGQRIYFNNGTTAGVVKKNTATGGIDVFSYTSTEAGAFFIGDALGAYELYAVRFVPTVTEPDPEVVSVFLTAGQSNTAGRCMNENLPEYIKAMGTAYQYCNWSYTNGMTRKSESEGVLRKFWPEMESSNTPGRFAYDAITYYYIEQALQKNFYVVKHATGGTSIDPSCTSTNDYHWSADATWLAANASCNETDGKSMLKALCSNIDKTLDALTAAGKTPDVKCMLWHQGESDRSGTGPDGYHDNLKAVVKYVRDYLVAKTGDEKYATLPFIAGTVPTNSKQYNKKVYDALFALASEDANFHVIETSPGTFIGDQLHFDANCAERLGIGMYNKMVDLELVDGEKQTVPDANIPEDNTITLDFKTWATENVGANTVYQNLILSNEGMKTLDGETTIYKVTGCEAEADFSEFAETFAIANTQNKVRMRGSVGLQLTSGNVTTFSILNLKPGDGVTITFGSGSSGVTTLAVLSENIFVYGDEDQKVLEKGTALTSKTVTYVVKTGTQIDLTFGSTGGHYINSIVIELGKVEIEETTGTPVVHMCGDSMMSIYGDESSDESANATYTQGMRGWGQFFQDYLTTESGIIVQDWAHTGTTAKGFYSGANYWPVVMGTNTMTDAYILERPYVKDFVPVKAGDYVILCWGHNDQKGGTLHNGYKTITESEYITYLTTMVNEVKAKGAYPILATSICRALFSGKTLTRLGMIDACEAAGETHLDENDPFDYPEAMRKLAEQLDIPCIDLNAASKTLWEDFGPGLTASVFFEGVGTTHTAEKGARAMGIAANLLIQEWDTSDETYADYAELKAAMKAGVEQYKKEDYASSETIVATETVWTFEKSADGETTYASGDVIASALVDFNGLYLRANASHTLNAQGVSGSFTFSNDKQVSYGMGLISSAMSNSPCAETAGAAVSNNTDRCVAINTSGPGTFYIAMRTKGNATEGRLFNLAFDGEVVDSKASSKSVVELMYKADKAGVFYAWGTEGVIIVAAQYVPTADSSEDDMHEKTTVDVTIGSQGYSSFSSISALDFSEVDGLKAYVVSQVNESGLAVLSSVDNAPAETGLILSGEAGKTYSIPVAASAVAPASNLLVATVEQTPVAASTDAVHNYMFANGSNGLGFYHVASATTSAAGRAYLSTTTPLSVENTGARSFVIENETTGVAAVKSETAKTVIYNLAGQRMANGQLPKGMYLVNGKKVMIK